MKCRTSSSDLAILKKDLTRFAPAWLGLCAYLTIWAVNLLTTDVYNGMFYEPIAPIFAPILAIVLFSYLFDPKECFMVHSLPIRRERLFGIHILSGLTMFLVPTAFFCLVTRNVTEQTAMYRFLFTTAEFLLLFSIGVLCAMLAGRMIGAAGIFLFIIALPGMLDYIVQDLYLPSLPGVYLPTDFYAWNPLLIVSGYANFYDRTTFVALDWLFLVAVVLISMALLGVSLLLYRKRKLEHAGDLLSVSTLEPVFAVCAFFSGAAIMTSMFFGPDATVLLGTVVGYYGYWMLSRKTARVFTKKVNLGMVGLLAFFIVSGLVVELDPLGRVHYVPEVEQIETASLRTAPGSLDRLETADPAMIERIMDLHRDLLETAVDGGQDSRGPQFHIVYKLTNGQTIQRNYTCSNESLIDQWDWFLSQPEAVFGSENPEFARIAVEYDHLTYRIILTEERMNELCEIMLKECRSGDMHHYRNDYYYWELTIYLEDKAEPVHLWVPDTAVETIAWLETNCAP